MAQPRLTYPIRSSSVSFYPATPSGEYGVTQASYSELIQTWQSPVPYIQKVGLEDKLCIQVHTQLNATVLTTLPQLFICDKYKTRLTAYDLSVAPWYKGSQRIEGNNFYNIYDGTTLDLLTTTWAFAFKNFIDEGTYYLELVNNADTDPPISYYSEPLFVRNSLNNTIKFDISYNANNSRKAVVIGGWWNDYPTNSISYNPEFSFRLEGFLKFKTTLSVLIAYLNGNYNQRNIQSQSFDIFDLKIGDLTQGIAAYVMQKANECMLADNIYISSNQYPKPQKYILHLPEGTSKPTEIFKLRDADARPLVYAACQVRYIDNSQLAIISPPPIVPVRVHSSAYSAAYN